MTIDTKIIWSISTLADHVQLQTDLDNLAKWYDMWQLNFNAKCKVIHFRRATHSYGDYYLNGILLDSSQLIVIKTWASYLIQVKFHQHASETAMKANRVLACVRRGFINLNESVLLQLHKSLFWPILEYENVICMVT